MSDYSESFRHDIGLITSAGTSVTRLPAAPVVIAEGTTYASIRIDDQQFLGVDIALAGGPTTMAVVHHSQDPKQPIVHNPMMAFWTRAVMYYEARNNLSETRGYVLRFDDYALIISDLGQSLYMLFGRHWNKEAKAKYAKAVGTPPVETPDLLKLLEMLYPRIGWDLPKDDAKLWSQLKDFILSYYQDIVKHFEYDKFEKALLIDIHKLRSFMECTRLTWIWFITKLWNLPFDPDREEFREFRNPY